MRSIAEVLSFWFSEAASQQWFAPTAEFDREIRERFADFAAHAARGELSAWEESPEGCLALCILLDQMPRNIYRGTPRVYAADHLALEIAERAVDRGFDRSLPPERRQFLYLPFSHSERLADQLRAVALFEAAGLEEALVYVRGHLRTIRRFGRFPHRNAILGRARRRSSRFWRATPTTTARAPRDRLAKRRIRIPPTQLPARARPPAPELSPGPPG